MPKVNVYLPTQLATAAQAYDLPLSEVCQRALRDEIARHLPVERLTPRMRALLIEAAALARAVRNDFVGTEHFVLALLADPNSVATQAIAELLPLEKVRRRVRERLVAASSPSSGSRIFDETGNPIGYLIEGEDGTRRFEEREGLNSVPRKRRRVAPPKAT